MILWRKFFRDIFTGRDNRTYDMGRVLWFQSVQAFILVTVYALHKGGSFDPVMWGAGLSALIAGGGAAIGLKSSTEPANPDASQDYLDAVAAAKAKVRAINDTSNDDDDGGYRRRSPRRGEIDNPDEN